MVDLKAVNYKLMRRSERILGELSGRSRDEVRQALLQANGSVKLALLILEGCSLDDATRILDRVGGQLRAAKVLMDKRGIPENRGRRT